MTSTISVDTSNQTTVLRNLAKKIAAIGGYGTSPRTTIDDLRNEIIEGHSGQLYNVQRDWLMALFLTHRHEVRHGDYIGPRYPKAVLIGDEPGTKIESYGAFTPWASGCGMHLLVSMASAGLTLREIGLVNSRHLNIGAMFVHFNGPRLIALGRKAHTRLYVQNLPIAGYVYHPQYELRFRHRETGRYGSQILEATKSWAKSC